MYNNLIKQETTYQKVKFWSLLFKKKKMKKKKETYGLPNHEIKIRLTKHSNYTLHLNFDDDVPINESKQKKETFGF